jgi:hypothetical protein
MYAFTVVDVRRLFHRFCRVPRVRLAAECLALMTGFGLSPASAGTLQATMPSVDDIIARHIEARGGLEAIQAVETIRMSGTMSMGSGPEAPVVIEMKRPGMMRMDVTVQGITGTQAFDGREGWAFMPFAGMTSADVMPPDVVAEARASADFDGPLIESAAKGHEIALAGTTTVDGRRAYRLTLRLKTGQMRDVYLDADTFLEIKTEGRRRLGQDDVVTESVMRDHRKVGNIVLPHVIESGIAGAPDRQVIRIEKIELNVPLAGGRFKRPL